MDSAMTKGIEMTEENDLVTELEALTYSFDGRERMREIAEKYQSENKQLREDKAELAGYVLGVASQVADRERVITTEAVERMWP